MSSPAKLAPKWIYCEAQLLSDLLDYLQAGVPHKKMMLDGSECYYPSGKFHGSTCIIVDDSGMTTVSCVGDKPPPAYHQSRCVIFVGDRSALDYIDLEGATLTTAVKESSGQIVFKDATLPKAAASAVNLDDLFSGKLSKDFAIDTEPLDI